MYEIDDVFEEGDYDAHTEYVICKRCKEQLHHYSLDYCEDCLDSIARSKDNDDIYHQMLFDDNDDEEIDDDDFDEELDILY